MSGEEWHERHHSKMLREWSILTLEERGALITLTDHMHTTLTEVRADFDFVSRILKVDVDRARIIIKVLLKYGFLNDNGHYFSCPYFLRYQEAVFKSWDESPNDQGGDGRTGAPCSLMIIGGTESGQ